MPPELIRAIGILKKAAALVNQDLGKLPKDRPVLLYCAGGYRSSIAASLLQRAGFDSVSEIAGGIAGWETAGLPIQTPQTSA